MDHLIYEKENLNASSDARVFVCLLTPFTDVKGELDDLLKTRKNFEARVGFTEDLKELSVGFYTHLK